MAVTSAGANEFERLGYRVDIADIDPIEIPAPDLPDIAGYTIEEMLKRRPVEKDGEVNILPMLQTAGFMQFLTDESDGRLKKLQGQEPKSAVIQNGVFTPQTLFKKINDPAIMGCDGKICTLHIPLYIGRYASLVLEDGDIIRLNANKGAFITGIGSFFSHKATVQAWDVASDKSASYVNDETFRPFLTFWNGAEVYIGESTFIDLGYQGVKSYGLTFSSNKDTPDVPAKSIWILDSVFEGLMYGFYTYEVKNAVLLRNKYTRNIYYGIDPHDRSEKLIIGYNEVSETVKRHGIILSREVNNSWVFNNKSYKNAGSGIMIDRSSAGNVVAYNLSEDNDREGIYIAESMETKLFENITRNNKKSGIRIRNSSNVTSYRDVIEGSGDHGFYAYSLSLDHLDRDMKRDPYEKRLDFKAIGTVFKNNAKSLMKVRGADHVILSGFTVEGVPKLGLLTGDLGFFKDAVTPHLPNPEKMIEFINFRHVDNDGKKKKSAYFKSGCEILTCRDTHTHLPPPHTPPRP